MYQEALSAHTTTCQFCQERPIERWKWLACTRCYQRERTAGRIKTGPSLKKHIIEEDRARRMRGVCWGCRKETVEDKKTGRCGYCSRVAKKGFAKQPQKSKPSLIYLGPLPNSPFLYKPHPSTRKAFCIRLMESRGVEVFNDFDLITNHYAYNLTEISKRYGFTRERMRQIYTSATGLRMRVISKIKTEKVLRDISEMTCHQDPRHRVALSPKNSHAYKGAIREVRFMEEAERRGCTVNPACDNSTDFIVNGWRVEVKGTSGFLRNPGSITGYLSFGITKNEIAVLDFVAAYHNIEMCWFIIPRESISQHKDGSSRIFISEHKTNYYGSKNRYWEYRDAWHLLEAP